MMEGKEQKHKKRLEETLPFEKIFKLDGKIIDHSLKGRPKVTQMVIKKLKCKKKLQR